MGFAPQWLALREPADAAARDAGLMDAAAPWAGTGAIVDLGAGTGATVRAFRPLLGDGQRWRLVDHDPQLLARAVARHLGAEAHLRDLARLRDLPLAGAGLVTASALLDLVSDDWLAGLVAQLAPARLPFYAALSYDGMMRWWPELPDDAAITAAFNADQRRDKGFGPALGPDAADSARHRFEGAGYMVRLAPSPWRLTPAQAALQAQLLHGIAEAAAREGQPDAMAWRDRRLALLAEARCEIGHLDLLAVPPGSTPQRNLEGGGNG